MISSIVLSLILFSTGVVLGDPIIMGHMVCPKISDECLENHEDIRKTEESIMEPDFAMHSLICFLGNNTVEDCNELGMKNKMALPLAFNNICLEPCEGHNSCIFDAGKRFLCQIKSFQPQIFDALKKKYMPDCPVIPEECIENHKDIKDTLDNLHNPGFLASAMNCFMDDGLEACKDNHLLIKNKMALPLVFNDICMPPCEGYHKCVDDAGKKFLCIMKNIQPILYNALNEKYSHETR